MICRFLITSIAVFLAFYETPPYEELSARFLLKELLFIA